MSTPSKWEMYDTIMRKAEANGELSVAQWAQMMRDRQPNPVTAAFNEMFGRQWNSSTGDKR